jgi:hypothetical protein
MSFQSFVDSQNELSGQHSRFSADLSLAGENAQHKHTARAVMPVEGMRQAYWQHDVMTFVHEHAPEHLESIDVSLSADEQQRLVRCLGIAHQLAWLTARRCAWLRRSWT